MTATLEDNVQLRETGSDAGPPRPFQLGSYPHLLRFPALRPASQGSGKGADIQGATGRADAVIDAIIVPTIRSAEQLRSAVKLAVDARCQLVTLHSHRFPDGLASVLGKLGRDVATPLALRSSAAHHLLDLAAGLPQAVHSPSAFDISRKRNLGLLIGRACGWRRMLFLDDDIRWLNADRLCTASAGLNEYPVVGLQVGKYPDASVIGHARRLTGYDQKPFISGGSLLVNPQRLNGFFPAVYHEDWLCIINHLRLGEVAVSSQVKQLDYHPFRNSERARFEEFGDILAFGLLWLIHDKNKTAATHSTLEGKDSTAAQRDYWDVAIKPRFWREVLAERAILLDDLARRLQLRSKQDMSPLESVRTAQQQCSLLSPEEFVSFIRKWIDNLSIWQDQMSSLPKADSVVKALDKLGLLHVVRMHEGNRGRVRAAWAFGTSSARQMGVKARSVGSALTRDDLDETTPSGFHSPVKKLRSRIG